MHFASHPFIWMIRVLNVLILPCWSDICYGCICTLTCPRVTLSPQEREWLNFIMKSDNTHCPVNRVHDKLSVTVCACVGGVMSLKGMMAVYKIVCDLYIFYNVSSKSNRDKWLSIYILKKTMSHKYDKPRNDCLSHKKIRLSVFTSMMLSACLQYVTIQLSHWYLVIIAPCCFSCYVPLS